MIQNFTEFQVWQVADSLFEMIVEDTEGFPKTIIGKILSDQVIRSIGSVNANIAEGVGRGGKNELVRFLIIARGSVVESQNWILKIYKLKWITKKRFEQYMEKFSLERKLINGFIGKLRRP